MSGHYFNFHDFLYADQGASETKEPSVLEVGQIHFDGVGQFNTVGDTTKALGGGLFELRLKGAKGIARVLYCTQVGRKIYMLHSFIKKTNKISQTDLETGITHVKEVKDGNAPGDNKKVDETPGSEGGSGKNRKRRRRTT